MWWYRFVFWIDLRCFLAWVLESRGLNPVHRSGKELEFKLFGKTVPKNRLKPIRIKVIDYTMFLIRLFIGLANNTTFISDFIDIANKYTKSILQIARKHKYTIKS